MTTTAYHAYYANSVYVEMDEVEIQTAASCGRWIYKLSQDGKHKDYHRQKPDGPSGERIQQVGEIAAWALAKYLDKYPMAFRTYKGSDLSGNIEARLIGVEWYGLRVYQKDVDLNKIVVGIVMPKGKERDPIRIAGWIRARDATHDEWWQNPGNRERGFWAVPQSHLRHIDELHKDHP